MHSDKSTIEIPGIKRDGLLKNRLIPITFIGFDEVFGKKGALYFRLLCRLIDKAAKDYLLAKDLIEKEIRSSDNLTYRFSIIDHLEDCFSSINRVVRIVNILKNGKVVEKSTKRCAMCKQKIKKVSTMLDECDFLKFARFASYKKIQDKEVKDVRNRIEHIDEDIYFGKISGPVFLDIDEHCEGVILNGVECSFSQLASVIEKYHEFMLEIIDGLPNKGNGGIFYDENDKEWERPK